MKNSLNLSIAKPCSENWSNFTPTQDGAFCGTCNKVVVDFTRMSDADIAIFFASSTDTCGRFRLDQLASYQPVVTPRINTGAGLLKAGFLSLFFSVGRKSSRRSTHRATAFEATRGHFSGASTSIEGHRAVKR